MNFYQWYTYSPFGLFLFASVCITFAALLNDYGN